MSRELTPSMRRSVLIAALRDEALRDGHQWNFCHFPGCAVGLANKLFGLNLDLDCLEDGPSPLRVMHQTFGTWEPFGSGAYDVGDKHVTPAMVADRLEAVHRELEAVS